MFENLDPSLQNVLLYNYDYMARVLLIIFIFAFSLYYLLFKDVSKKSAFIFIQVIDFIGSIGSKIILFLSPFFIFLLSPNYTFNSMLNFFFLGFILPTMSLALFLISIDALKFGIKGALYKCGIDICNTSEREVIRRRLNC